MAPKTGKEKGSSTLPAPPTRCEQGGEELLPNFIQLRSQDLLDLVLTLCNSSFRVAVVVDQTTVVDQVAEDEVKIILTPLSVGKHILHWAYFASAEDWQVKSEVEVNGIVRFRQRKGSASGKPFNHSFLFLEVVQ